MNYFFRQNAGIVPIFPSDTMTAAAPDGTPPRRIGDKNFLKAISPLCLGEALRQGVNYMEMVTPVRVDTN